MAEPERAQHGMVVRQGSSGARLDIQCTHQNGVLYVSPAEMNWVCSQDLVHAHSLAGFLHELVALDDPRIYQLMQRWGLHYRPRPIEREET